MISCGRTCTFEGVGLISRHQYTFQVQSTSYILYSSALQCTRLVHYFRPLYQLELLVLCVPLIQAVQCVPVCHPSPRSVTPSHVSGSRPLPTFYASKLYLQFQDFAGVIKYARVTKYSFMWYVLHWFRFVHKMTYDNRVIAEPGANSLQVFIVMDVKPPGKINYPG